MGQAASVMATSVSQGLRTGHQRRCITGNLRPATPVKLRILLTNACSARCAYCHNEGQQKSRGMLATTMIETLLDALVGVGASITEVVLSGGEPTLHPQLAQIARRCKAMAAQVSINTNAAHPTKLASVLPWVDELKIHVDSFDARRQRESMGISIAKVRQSIEIAKEYSHLRIVLNHPLQTITEACAVITEARALGADCKLIELLDGDSGAPRLEQMPWAEMGYRDAGNGCWLHANDCHRILTRRCAAANDGIVNLFLSSEGIRRDFLSPLLGIAETLSLFEQMATTERVLACNASNPGTARLEKPFWLKVQ